MSPYQLNTAAANLRAEHARRMAWCEANPLEAASRYGLDILEREHIDPRRTWAREIAQELCGDQWAWQLMETVDGEVHFVVLEYRGRVEV